jgi:polysaccharide biosynthesis PFTS motif protein
LLKKYDIVIFDNTPHSILYDALTLLGDDNFLSQKTCINLIEDLEEVVFKKNISIVLKVKKLGKYHSRPYARKLNLLYKYKNLEIVKDEYSVEKLIQNSKNIIGFPFGTPGLNAKLFGKKAIFYHPGPPMIDIDNRINQDVPIIWGKKNLNIWLEVVLKN